MSNDSLQKSSPKFGKISLIALPFLFFSLFLIPIDTGGDVFFWGPLFDAGHFPLFFLCTLFLIFALPKAKSSSQLRLLLNPYFLASCLVIGVELIQPTFKRSASLNDINHGLLGVAAAGVFLQILSKKVSLQRVCTALLSLALLFGALLLPLYPAWKSIRWRKAEFPILANFNNTEEELLWRPISVGTVITKPTATLSFSKEKAHLAVKTKSGKWSGVSYAAGDKDWSSFSYLELTLENPNNEPLLLSIRIDDNEECEKYQDRFNNNIPLNPGITSVQIPIAEISNGPKSRTLNTTDIRWLFLFLNPETEDTQFNIHEIKLRK